MLRPPQTDDEDEDEAWSTEDEFSRWVLVRGGGRVALSLPTSSASIAGGPQMPLGEADGRTSLNPGRDNGRESKREGILL